ncbi:MAG: L-fucose/L-arabinose isomerase family protein [Planctomycetaceae bacterium]|jgi:L-arabinose isomerase|nr:L-fucose/L-arabinose isomerase family protein [Planctomycetaceae bacterium]
MNKEKKQNVKIGLFGIGLDTYWAQFDGLHDRLVGYQNAIAEKLAVSDVEVVNLGLVDNPVAAAETAQKFKREDVELIFLYVSTYSLSSTVLPVVQKANVPVVVLNLQPVKAIDYARFNALGDRAKMTGEWLAHCQACSVPEIANVFLRAGIRFHQVTGTLHDDPIAWNEIRAWIRAAQVAQTIRSCRIGLLGHYYNGMLDIYSSLTNLSAQFGVHFEILEMCELKENLANVSSDELNAKIRDVHELFDVQSDCPDAEIQRAAKTSVALDRLVKTHDLGAMAYFFNGTGDDSYVDLIASVIVGNSILTGSGVPVAGEYEVKNVLAMKILDAFGVGGSFTEFYAMDFNDDVVLMGHDGPGHTAIAQEKTKLKPLKVFHGKVGQGLSVETSVKHGEVTLLSVIDAPDGNAKFLIAEGESVPGPILEIGNTNSRYKFSTGARGFIDAWCSHGPAHHCAIGVGRLATELEKLAQILGIPAIRVC